MADGIYKNFFKKYYKIGKPDKTEDDFIKKSQSIILDLVLPNFDFLTPHYVKEFLNLFIIELKIYLDDIKRILKKLTSLKARTDKDIHLAFGKIWTIYLDRIKYFNTGYECFFNKVDLKTLKAGFSSDTLICIYKTVLLSFTLNDSFKVE
jgi:hypothetical protein